MGQRSTSLQIGIQEINSSLLREVLHYLQDMEQGELQLVKIKNGKLEQN